MVRTILRALVLVPLAVILVALAVANRHSVTVSLDPFSPEAPAFAFNAPLFVVVLVALIAGVLVGGAAAWHKQRKWRRAARRLERDTRADRTRGGTVRHSAISEPQSRALTPRSASASYPRPPAA